MNKLKLLWSNLGQSLDDPREGQAAYSLADLQWHIVLADGSGYIQAMDNDALKACCPIPSIKSGQAPRVISASCCGCSPRLKPLQVSRQITAGGRRSLNTWNGLPKWPGAPSSQRRTGTALSAAWRKRSKYSIQDSSHQVTNNL